MTEQRSCDKCSEYTLCYYAGYHVVCRECLLKMKGGPRWLEEYEWQEAESKVERKYRTYDGHVFNDWSSTAPETSKSRESGRNPGGYPK